MATTLTYDNNGNQLTETRAGVSQRIFSWDNDNRLKQLTTPAGSHSYEYDSRGIRTRQTTPTATTKYLLGGASVTAELDSAGTTTASYLNNPDAIDEQLSVVAGGQRLYPLTDALGSAVALTDSDGAVFRAYSYEAYGLRSTSGTGAELSFGFTGREHDGSGLRYHRDRYADGIAGRWNQPDRIGLADGPNRYQYSHGNPVRFPDASGFAPGDRFSTEAEAAIDALAWIRVRVETQKVEYAGSVYRIDSCGFTYTIPARGTGAQSLPSEPEDEDTVVAYFHGHPDIRDEHPEYDDPESFSKGDLIWAYRKERPMYLLTPSGTVKIALPPQASIWQTLTFFTGFSEIRATVLTYGDLFGPVELERSP